MSMDSIKVNLQYFLPKHLLTWGASVFANAKMGKVTTYAIKKYADFYHVDLEEMDGEIDDFETFNAFFSRPLKANARPIDNTENSVVFPSDGKISQYGDLMTDFQLQAKGHYFTTESLLGDSQEAEYFKDGKFITIYLAPSDYHRVHIPVTGRLLKMTYIPGELFSVNPLYTKHIPELLARNERVVCIFETPIGKMAVVFVGAVIVGSISTEWDGVVTSNNSNEIRINTYEKEVIEFAKGDEIGKFLMGSTVICLFEKDKIEFNSDLQCEEKTRVGEKMAQMINISKTTGAKRATTKSKSTKNAKTTKTAAKKTTAKTTVKKTTVKQNITKS